MKLSGNQALAQFVAAAASLSVAEVSARVGGGELRRAPTEKGYDPTSNIRRSRREEQNQMLYNRPSNQSIEKDLKLTTNDPDTNSFGRLRNTTVETKSTPKPQLTDPIYIDTGILDDSKHDTKDDTFSSSSSSLDTATSTCMMGYSADQLLPASLYLEQQLDENGNGYGNIVFNSATNSVVCNQKYDLDEPDGGNLYGCSSMHFRGCSEVHCNGKESCLNTVIEEADSILCEGLMSCKDATLDATIIDCGGEKACFEAVIGEKQWVSTLDCHSGDYACAYATTRSVGDVVCTGPFSCYGTMLTGVTESVTCQGVPHPNGYYFPTCGGSKGFIESAADHDINVVCNGDFSCIGGGDKSNSYMSIDVGTNGSLACEGSLVGNYDGETFVCRYIDVYPEYANYECVDPSTCERVKRRSIDGEDGDDDDFDVDDDVFDDASTRTSMMRRKS